MIPARTRPDRATGPRCMPDGPSLPGSWSGMRGRAVAVAAVLPPSAAALIPGQFRNTLPVLALRRTGPSGEARPGFVALHLRLMFTSK